MNRTKKICIVIAVWLTMASCNNDNRALVVGKIHQASKLATTEFTIDKLVHGTKTKRLAWLIKLNEARFLAYSRATVKTGINLEDLEKEDITIEGNSITIKLPPVEVINFSYPPKEFRLDENITANAFLNNISIEDQEQFFREAEIDIRNNLKYMGLVETTQQKTRTMLTGMLKNLGYKEIYITFQSDELIVREIKPEEE